MQTAVATASKGRLIMTRRNRGNAASRRVNRQFKDKSTFKIALGGIYLALTIMFLFGATMIPGIELTLFACSSFFVAFMLLETNVGGAILLYVAASLLGFVILPNKLAMFPFVFMFGYYGILKFYIEKLHGASLQLIVKIIYFAVFISIGLMGFFKVITSSIHLPNCSLAVLIITGTAMMIVYDFIYTYIIRFYETRIQHKGIDNIKLS